MSSISPRLTEVDSNYHETLQFFIDNVNLAREIAAENLKKHQEYNEQYHDRNVIEPDYEIKDFVYLYNPTTGVGLSKNSNHTGWDHTVFVN